MKKELGAGPYRLMGYSYGASVAIAMATQLQVVFASVSYPLSILLCSSVNYQKQV